MKVYHISVYQSKSLFHTAIEILLPVKFHWIPFSGSQSEVENVSVNQSPGRPSCFSDRPEKRKVGRGRWYLASCVVSLKSVKRFQRRSWKCLSQSEVRAAILYFRSARKNTNLVEDVEILLPIKFHRFPFCGFRGEVENVSANQRLGQPSCFCFWGHCVFKFQFSFLIAIFRINVTVKITRPLTLVS